VSNLAVIVAGYSFKSLGEQFHAVGQAKANARPPYVDKLIRGYVQPVRFVEQLADSGDQRRETWVCKE